VSAERPPLLQDGGSIQKDLSKPKLLGVLGGHLTKVLGISERSGPDPDYGGEINRWMYTLE
jgi:hypothetical protein